MAESSTLYAETALAGPPAAACAVTEKKNDFGRKPAPATPITIEKGGLPADRAPKTVLELALALLFHEIAHDACSIATAMGAAVWLLGGETPVRSGYSGSNALQVSTYLTHCSTASWKAGKTQLSQDALLDPRLDGGAWRRLGVRSFVAMPVRSQDKAVVAIIEVFSRQPHAFRHHDLLFLRDLCRRVADHIAAAEHVQRGLFAKTEPVPVLPSFSPSPRVPWFKATKLALRGAGNLLLGGLIILAAIFLGWILGRSERENTPRNEALRATSTQAEVFAQSTQATSTNDRLRGSNQDVELPPASTTGARFNAEDLNLEDRSQDDPALGRRVHSKRTASDSLRPKNSSGGIVIFEKGKQIFPPESSQSKSSSGDDRNDGGIQVQHRTDSPEPVAIVAEEVANKHLLNRVEPEYSESAREQRLQGTVILNIHVGKRGTVGGISRVSGDPQLALLAAKAVRQWKFSPLLRNSAPVSFESQITLSFALP